MVNHVSNDSFLQGSHVLLHGLILGGNFQLHADPCVVVAGVGDNGVFGKHVAGHCAGVDNSLAVLLHFAGLDAVFCFRSFGQCNVYIAHGEGVACVILAGEESEGAANGQNSQCANCHYDSDHSFFHDELSLISHM